ncbi:unnamed protein product [Urochloa decumbens]|uniref:J domain-containing protein n=1 Tax=Urochloa decumbens TaxID=240449 RepID=A0ABC9G611_9POAL
MALSLRLANFLTVGGPRRRHGAGARTTAAYAAARAAVSSGSGDAAARSPYEVLRVGEAAAPAEIRAAYRAMAKRAHPDAGGAGQGGEAFVELRRAYETLSDPAARARYDASVVARERSGGRSGPPGRTWETDQCW